ncbi:MAG: Rnf-Nqr domain containing protein [Gemmiger sp.]|nr:Rnf-Nqr domain containing protein [Gemmiger sp.]
MLNAVELTLVQSLAQFLSYAILAVFAENVIFSRALGMSSLLRLVDDPDSKTWQYCGPVILVQLGSAPLGWAAHNLFFPWLRGYLPTWLPIAALRPLVYLSCSTVVMALVWVALGGFPRATRQIYRAQLPGATYNCCVLGTLLICANQNFTLLQTLGFGLGSGLGYLFAVLIVDEGRRRLRSKDVPAIFRGLPSSLIYVGILSLAIYGLVGHAVSV